MRRVNGTPSTSPDTATRRADRDPDALNARKAQTVLEQWNNATYLPGMTWKRRDGSVANSLGHAAHELGPRATRRRSMAQGLYALLAHHAWRETLRELRTMRKEPIA